MGRYIRRLHCNLLLIFSEKFFLDLHPNLETGNFMEHPSFNRRVVSPIRIPFIIRYPGLIKDPGRRAHQMILNIDLAPTLLDIVGIEIPSNIQGQSLKRIMASADAPGRKSWLYEHFPVFPIPIPGITAVRTQYYKYVEYQNNMRPKGSRKNNFTF